MNRFALQTALTVGLICLASTGGQVGGEFKAIELQTAEGMISVNTGEIKSWSKEELSVLSKEDLAKVVPYLENPEAKEYAQGKVPAPTDSVVAGPEKNPEVAPPSGKGEGEQVSSNGGVPVSGIGGMGGAGGMGGSGSSPYQASGEVIERHGAIISPVRELSSTNEVPLGMRYTLTEKQVDDVKKGMAILSNQPMTPEEKKNLEFIVGKFYSGEVDAKTVSDEMGKIVARLESLQPLQGSTPASNSVSEKPDVTVNFDGQPLPNPFGVVGGPQTKIEVNQSSENEAKALIEKGLEAKKDGATIASANNDLSWLWELLNPSLFVDNVKQAMGAFFGSEFDPKVSKSLAALPAKGEGVTAVSQKSSPKNGRGVAGNPSQKSQPMVKHVTFASLLFLPFGLGVAIFFVWRKRKQGKAKVVATTQFKVAKSSSKTNFTEKDGTRVNGNGFRGFHPQPQVMTPPPRNHEEEELGVDGLDWGINFPQFDCAESGCLAA